MVIKLKKMKSKIKIRNIVSFFKEYFIDLIFYFYIVFFLYFLVEYFSNVLDKNVIATIWIVFFIPVFYFKLKKDQQRTKNYIENFLNKNKDK